MSSPWWKYEKDTLQCVLPPMWSHKFRKCDNTGSKHNGQSSKCGRSNIKHRNYCYHLYSLVAAALTVSTACCTDKPKLEREGIEVILNDIAKKEISSIISK